MSERPPGRLEGWDDEPEYYDVPDVILDPHNPDVLERIQQSGGYIHPVEYFGGAYITNCYLRNTYGKLWPETSAAAQAHDAKLPDVMARIRNDLATIAENDEVGPLFEARSSLIPDELRSKIFSDEGQQLSIALQAVDDDTLIAFINWNKSHIDSLQEEMLPRIDNIMRLFRQRASHAILHQNLPLSMEQLETRMNHITIAVVDPVSMLLHDREGHYRPAYLQVSIPAISNEDYLTQVTVHELLHHISGKTILDRDVTRSDLAFDSNTTAPIWMSEACAEQLTNLLLSDAASFFDFSRMSNESFFTADHHAYPLQRKVMRTLCSGDQRLMRLLLAAYFEDTRPHNEGRLPHTEVFWQTLATSLGFSTPKLAFDDLQAFGDTPATPELVALDRRLRFNLAAAQIGSQHA